MTVIALRFQPAYTPSGPPPGKCSTDGHGNQPARLYACGWRCQECSPWPGKTSSDEKGQAA